MFCLSAIYTGVFYKRIPSKLINKEKDVSNVQSNGLFHKTMESIKLMINNVSSTLVQLTLVYAGICWNQLDAEHLDSSKVTSRLLATSTELTNWLYKTAAHPLLPLYTIERKLNKNHYYNIVYDLLHADLQVLEYSSSTTHRNNGFLSTIYIWCTSLGSSESGIQR